MTGITCALAGAGGNPYQGSANVTVGMYYDPNPSFSFVYYGYSTGLIGSVSPSTWSQTNATIRALTFVQVFTTPTQWITFSVTGSYPNSGWTTMNVNGTILNRSAATYSNDGTNTTWTWFGASNSFGTTVGAVRPVSWV